MFIDQGAYLRGIKMLCQSRTILLAHAVLAATVTFACTFVHAQEPDWKKIRIRIEPSVLYIETKREGAAEVLRGTGFVISGTGYIMTAAHVITGTDLVNKQTIPYDPVTMRLTITVRQSESQEGIPAALEKHDSELDLAILKLSRAVTWAPLCVIDSETTEVESHLFTVGYPRSSFVSNPTAPPISSAHGRLTGRTGYFQRWKTSVAFGSGNSGGPVVDVDGNVVAVCKEGYPGETATFVIPTAFVKILLRDVQMPPNSQCKSITTATSGRDREQESRGPSFDCSTHFLPTERAICANNQLSMLDRGMAEEYDHARASLGVSEVRQLRQEQREWISARNECSADTACLRRQYEQRIAVLKAAVAGTRIVKPSFDCATHFLSAERAVCANARLAQLDVTMARLYEGARAGIASDRSDALRQEQRAWITARNQCDSDVKCIGERYQRRIAQLEFEAVPQDSGPSFDCQTHSTPAEVAICKSSLLAALDRRMANVYYALFARLDGQRQAALRADQIEWLRRRANCGSDTNCLQAQYENRIEQLDRAERT